MHLYAFGSICRGEVSLSSDVDLLAIVEGFDDRFDPSKFSIYSYAKIGKLWSQGNPFAWHLALESRLLFSSEGSDYISELGSPQPYLDGITDCQKFRQVFREGYASLVSDHRCHVFDLSSMFLGIRNFATCYSLSATSDPSFSRNSALLLKNKSLSISDGSYKILERARLLSTRGWGDQISEAELAKVLEEISTVEDWMMKLLDELGQTENG